MVIAYDGTAYAGWQFQENALGIQQLVEEALAYIERAPVRVYGSSRTDAGVHAEGFVAHFRLTKPVPPPNVWQKRRTPTSSRLHQRCLIPRPTSTGQTSNRVPLWR